MTHWEVETLEDYARGRAFGDLCRFRDHQGPPHPAERNDLFGGTHHVNGILPPTSTFALTGEVAWIRLPDIALPVGCHSGWNPRHPDHGAPGLPAIFVGFSLFDEEVPPADECERRVRAWTQWMIETGHVLAEDQELVVANCLRVHRAAREQVATCN